MVNDNLHLWNKHSEVDPHALKHVSYGKREYTSIDAYTVFEKATEEWGPMGKSWGLRNTKFEFLTIEGTAQPHVVLTAEFFYPEGSIPVGADEVLAKGNDAIKKLTTSCLKKGLSYVGFGASVHKGQFEDDRAIEAARERWDKETSHENTVARLNNALNTAIGCKHDEDRDVVCQWLLEPGMTYERTCETEGAPSAALNEVKKHIQEGLVYPDMLAAARKAVLDE